MSLLTLNESLVINPECVEALEAKELRTIIHLENHSFEVNIPIYVLKQLLNKEEVVSAKEDLAQAYFERVGVTTP